MFKKEKQIIPEVNEKKEKRKWWEKELKEICFSHKRNGCNQITNFGHVKDPKSSS